MMHHYGNWMGRGSFNYIGLIVLLLIIGLIVFLVSQVLQANNKKTKNPSDEAVDILNQRLAKGEISEEEYREKKKLLTE